jgi:hypothetical protein
MEKPSLLPLLDRLLPLDEAKVAEAARLVGVPLAQAFGVVAYYPRYRGLPQGRLLVDDPVARARGFARLRQEAEGTYPPLGLEALSPIYLRFQNGERFVEVEGGPVPFAEFRLPFSLAHGKRLIPPEPVLELPAYRALGGAEGTFCLAEGAPHPGRGDGGGGEGGASGAGEGPPSPPTSKCGPWSGGKPPGTWW